MAQTYAKIFWRYPLGNENPTECEILQESQRTTRVRDNKRRNRQKQKDYIARLAARLNELQDKVFKQRRKPSRVQGELLKTMLG